MSGRALLNHRFGALVFCLLAVAHCSPVDECADGDCGDHNQLLQIQLDTPRHAPVGPAPGQSCAVCFIGQLRNLNQTRDSISRNFLAPIAAAGVGVDVFVASSMGGPFLVSDLELPNGVAIRDFSWQQEPSVPALEALISGAATPRAAVEHYKSTPGYWLGPAFGQPGNMLRVYRHEAKCVEMFQEWEFAHNMRYTWVVRTRPDFLWSVPHPPLSLFSTDMLWTMDTESYAGMNGRHVVGGRGLMIKGMLSKLKLLASGDPVVYKMNLSEFPSDTPSSGTSSHMGDELFAKKVVDDQGIHLARFPTIASLVECPSWSNCWRALISQSAHVNFTVYPLEQQAAAANAARWQSPKACWQQSSRDVINISYSCQG